MAAWARERGAGESERALFATPPAPVRLLRLHLHAPGALPCEAQSRNLRRPARAGCAPRWCALQKLRVRARTTHIAPCVRVLTCVRHPGLADTLHGDRRPILMSVYFDAKKTIAQGRKVLPSAGEASRHRRLQT
jgi:hypothetical protein